MAGQANSAFMTRHLLQTEFPLGRLQEVPGGFLVSDNAVWIAVHSPEAVTDAEDLVKSGIALSATDGLPLAGGMIFQSASGAASPAIDGVEEALYIYGYPRAKGLHRGGPDMISVLPNTPPLVPKSKLYFEAAQENIEAVQQLFAMSQQTADRVTGPPWNRSKAWIERAEPWVAVRDSTPVGLLSYIPGELMGRIAVIIVMEDERGKGYGRELVGYAQTLGAQQGAQFTAVWNYREGKLRYYMGKLGFQEQFTVRYFLAGQPE
jgi:GNAT superfamily N-acetyltransferase